MNTYKRHRFPPEIIQYAVWVYFRFNLSIRDVEDLLAQRGVIVSYEAIRLLVNQIWNDYLLLNMILNKMDFPPGSTKS
jgi:transposase-like protein